MRLSQRGAALEARWVQCQKRRYACIQPRVRRYSACQRLRIIERRKWLWLNSVVDYLFLSFERVKNSWESNDTTCFIGSKGGGGWSTDSFRVNSEKTRLSSNEILGGNNGVGGSEGKCNWWAETFQRSFELARKSSTTIKSWGECVYLIA